MVAIWVLITAGVIAVVWRLPVVYKGEAVILVESQRIPEKYVASTVNADLQDRLNTISQQILSSSQLTEIIQKFDLYPDARKKLPLDEVIQQMRDDVSISIETGPRKERPGAFRIAYMGANPNLVPQIANYIGSLFIDENIRTRESQAEGTSEFLENQLAQAKGRLEEQEAKLSVYKLKYNGELPEQEHTLATALGQFELQLQGIQESISRAEEQKLMLQNALESAKTSMDALSRAGAGIGRERSGPGELPSTERNSEKKSDQLRVQLDMLRMRYTENHPDIKLAKAELARTLRQEAADERAGLANAASQPNAASTRPLADSATRLQMEQTVNRERERADGLKGQLEATAAQLQSLESERGRITQSIADYQARLEKLPLREQQLAAVSRDYETSKLTYRSLLDKKLSANVATDMEKNQQPERFTMLDPAKVPQKPLKPDRPLLSILGSLLGLFVGATFAVAMQAKANVLLGEWELPAGAWVLARVPVIDPAAPDPPRGDRRSGRKGAAQQPRLRWALVFSTLLLVLGTVVAAGVYFGWV